MILSPGLCCILVEKLLQCMIGEEDICVILSRQKPAFLFTMQPVHNLTLELERATKEQDIKYWTTCENRAT